MENISLIKEVQKFMSVEDAQKLARDHLKLISFEDVAQKRVNNCGEIEIFYVKFIRALFSDAENILISTPFRILQSIENIDKIINNLLKYETQKNIVILDLFSNEHRYKGSACNTIK
jgi:ABC-type proline/glycine betaine transport system ATPase subunit